MERSSSGERYSQKTVLYRNLGDGRFADLTARAGPALQTPRPARGMAAGDLDGDGHPEVVIVNMNQPPSLLKNVGEHGNSILVRLIGTKSNRSAIGARVTVSASGRQQMQEVLSGGSYYSQSDLMLHFGLGPSDSIDELKVRWPSGLLQEWRICQPTASSL